MNPPWLLPAAMGTLVIAWLAMPWILRTEIDGTGSTRFWTIALGCRIAAIATPPLFEDDYFRFLWDGHQFLSTGNPYRHTPSEFFQNASVSGEWSEILSGINHPEVSTIYGPVLQYAFAIGAAIRPGSLLMWKTVLLAADLIFLTWMRRSSLAGFHSFSVASWIWATCPLVIFETFVQGHPELLGIVPAFLALERRHRLRRPDYISAALIGLAFAARFHALLAIPFVLAPGAARRNEWVYTMKSLMATLLTVAVLYLPFWLQGSLADLGGLKAMAEEWEFNSSWYHWAEPWLGSGNTKFLGLGATAMVSVFAWGRFVTNRMPMDQAFAATLMVFFITSPVVNPWYLLWFAWPAMQRPHPAWCLGGAAVALSYFTYRNLGLSEKGSFSIPEMIRVSEYLLLATAAWMIIRAGKQRELPSGR